MSLKEIFSMSHQKDYQRVTLEKASYFNGIGEDICQQLHKIMSSEHFENVLLTKTQSYNQKKQRCQKL